MYNSISYEPEVYTPCSQPDQVPSDISPDARTIREPSRIVDSPLDGVRPYQLDEHLCLVYSPLNSIPTGRGSSPEDGSVAEFLAGVLEPFTVLGMSQRIVDGGCTSGGAVATFGCSGWAGWLGSGGVC